MLRLIYHYLLCRGAWVAVEDGYIERTGSTLTAGVIVGTRTKHRCNHCGARMMTRKLF